ncbi:MAG: tRNA pseudouridine(38-40) synthase TruA, partial [Bacteroidota bacterium]
MARYFIELSYLGENYSGFQIQDNANTVQSELEKALKIYFRIKVELTGSSRTDAGVNANMNFFHFDIELNDEEVCKAIYPLNAILPNDISVNKIIRVGDDAHCRFDAISRTYKYRVYQEKNPFLQNRAYYYPYNLDTGYMNEAATILMGHTNFEAFSKKHVQVRDFRCKISESFWTRGEGSIVYQVTGNRFLRGMVRGLVGTMLKVGTGKISLK